MTSMEFKEWKAFYNLYPFDLSRLDRGFAMLAAILVNQNRGKNSKIYSEEDFMPEFYKKETKKKGISREQVAAFMSAHGASPFG